MLFPVIPTEAGTYLTAIEPDIHFRGNVNFSDLLAFEKTLLKKEG